MKGRTLVVVVAVSALVGGVLMVVWEFVLEDSFVQGSLGEASWSEGAWSKAEDVAEGILFAAFVLVVPCFLLARNFVKQVRSERAVKVSERRFKDFTETGSDWYWETDADLRYSFISDGIVAVTGVPPEQHIGRSMQELSVRSPPQDNARIKRDLLQDRRPFREFTFQEGTSGSEKWLRSSGHPIFDEQGAFQGYRGVTTNITDQVQAEERVRQAEARLRGAILSLRDGFAYFDADDRLVICNEEFRKVYETVAGRIVPGAYFRDLLEAFVMSGAVPEAAGHEQTYIDKRLKLHRKSAGTIERQYADGNWYLIAERRTSDGGVCLIVTDITELKNREAELRRVQSLEAVGQLTAGIAHEFNNLLMGVVGNLDVLETCLGDDSNLKVYAEQAIRSAMRGRDLSDRLLAFARKQPLRPRNVDINEVVSHVVELLRPALGEKVEIVTFCGKELWPSALDPEQLESAFVNLAVNAWHAMPSGGRLTIETRNVKLDGTQATLEDDAPAGDYVLATVKDTGDGMAPDVVQKAFEPFFTTRETGDGTGLGLSMVYGFVKQSRGRIEIDSKVGQGTAVRMYLPRVAGPGAEALVHEGS